MSSATFSSPRLAARLASARQHLRTSAPSAPPGQPSRARALSQPSAAPAPAADPASASASAAASLRRVPPARPAPPAWRDEVRRNAAHRQSRRWRPPAPPGLQQPPSATAYTSPSSSPSSTSLPAEFHHLHNHDLAYRTAFPPGTTFMPDAAGGLPAARRAPLHHHRQSLSASGRGSSPSSSSPSSSSARPGGARGRGPGGVGVDVGVGGPGTTTMMTGATAAMRETLADSRARLYISYADLERALARRGVKSTRALLAAAAAALAAAALAWPRIKQWGAVEGAEVAAASLETEQLQSKAVDMVNDVLTDPKTATKVQEVLRGAVLGLLDDPDFTSRAIDWSAHVLAESMTKQNMLDQGTEYVQTVLADGESLAAAQQFLGDAMKGAANDAELQDSVASGFWSAVRASIIGRRATPPAPPPSPASEPEVAQAGEAEAVTDVKATANSSDAESANV